MTNNRFLLRRMNVHLDKIAVISLNQLPRFGWKNFEVNRRMSPDSATFYFILSVQLCSRFKEFEVSSMPMYQVVIPRGTGTFSRDLTKTSPCSEGILPGLCIWKNQYPR